MYFSAGGFRTKSFVPTENLPLVGNGEPEYKFEHNGTQVKIIRFFFYFMFLIYVFLQKVYIRTAKEVNDSIPNGAPGNVSFFSCSLKNI